MIDRVLRARVYVLIAYAALLVLGIVGALRLTIDPNNRVFFSPSHHHFENLLDLEARFGPSTNLLFVFEADASLFKEPRVQSAIVWLTQEAWRVDEVISVESIATFPKAFPADDELVVQDVLSYVCSAGGPCKESRAAALLEPYLVGRFVGEDARAFSVVAKVDLSDPSVDSVGRIANAAAKLKSDFAQTYPEFPIYLTGGVPMMQAFYDAAEADARTLMMVALGVLLVVLYLFLGGLLPTLFMAILGISSVVLTMGFAGWFGFVINTATATVPLIVFTLVVTAAMHVFLHIVREGALDSQPAIMRAVKVAVNSNARPVMLTAATTCVGLLSMVFVSAPPIRELGLLSAFGVAAGAVFSLTVVPCMFSLLGNLKVSDYLSRLQMAMNQYARRTEFSSSSALVTLLFFSACLAGVARVSIDEDFVRYFSPGAEFRKDTESISGLLTGPYNLDVVYDSGTSLGIFDSRSVTDVSSLVEYLRAHPQVVSVLSFVDVLGEVSQAMSGSGELAGRTKDELAQFLLTYELSLGIGQSTQHLMDSDQRLARISILLDDVSMRGIRSIADDIQQWADARGIAGDVTITGEGMPTSYLSSESIKEMGWGILLSMLLSSLLVGIYFKGIKVAAVVLSATVLPILAGFGLWGWISSDIGMAATLVVAITIGVVVDDTIHLTYRYVDSVRNLDLTPAGAAAYSIHKTGTALVVSSITMGAGLMVLVLSEFRMNSTFGACATLIIGLALLYNLSVTPRLLKRVA